MPDQFSRTRLQFGAEGIERLQRAHVAVFGIGGVGGHCAEALARGGVGAIDLIDHDTVSLTARLWPSTPPWGGPRRR